MGYNSILDLVRDIDPDDDQFVSELNQAIQERQLSTMLTALRCKRDMTQKQVAEQLGWNQSKVSDFENSTTGRIKVEDMAKFAHAIGLNVEINFSGPTSIAERVKRHAFAIRNEFKKLSTLAADDKEINHGALEFCNEAILNMNLLLLQSRAEFLSNNAETKANAQRFKKSMDMFLDTIEAIADRVEEPAKDEPLQIHALPEEEEGEEIEESESVSTCK